MLAQGYVLTTEMVITRQQPDGTDAIETVTVEQAFDAAGQPVGEPTEVIYG